MQRGCSRSEEQIHLSGPLRFINDGCLEHKFGGWILAWNKSSVIDCWCLPWARIFIYYFLFLWVHSLPTIYIWDSGSLRSQSVVLVPWQRLSHREIWSPVKEQEGLEFTDSVRLGWLFCKIPCISSAEGTLSGELQLWQWSWQATGSTLPFAHQMVRNLSWQNPRL